MHSPIIFNTDQITEDWLTSVLKKSRALFQGEVVRFELGTGRGNWSRSAQIRVQYSENAEGSLPQRLFLKMVDTDLGEGESFGDSEVTYYLRDYVDVKNAPLIRCYDAGYCPELQRYHLLLDDVSETHCPATEKEPTLEYGMSLAEAFALLHARWWGPERLAEAGETIHSASHILRFAEMAEPGVRPILQGFGSELKPHWAERLKTFFVRHPKAMIRRAADPEGFTLIHGDAGCYNIMVPRHSQQPLYLIDRQPFTWSLTVWLGVYDLTYALVLDWDVEKRRAYEEPILRKYHESLLRNRVENYTWERLYDDYRLCVAMGIYIATEYCRGGINEPLTHIWLPMLQRALIACDDHACDILW